MIAPISSSSFAVESSPTAQTSQQNFSATLQQLQSGEFSAQTPSSTIQLQGGTPAQHIVDGSSSSSHHAYRHHPTGGQTDDSDSSSTNSLGQLGQPVQATTASTAQQAYGSLDQDLQQVALNSDLLNAQTAFLQNSVLSVSA